MKRLSVLFLGCMLMFACRRENTSWTSEWGVPLINDTLSLKNLVNDSTLVTNGAAYALDLTRTVLDLGIEDIIEFPDTSIEHVFHPAFNNFTVAAGASVVNSIEEHNLDLQDVQLKLIRVKSGSLVFTVYNPLPTTCNFTVKLPGVSKNGTVFQQTFSVGPGSTNAPNSAQGSLNLSGYEISMIGVTGGSVNVLQSQLLVSTDVNGPMVTLNTQQEFKISANLSGITVDYARGYFGQQVVSTSKQLHLDAMDSYLSGSIDLTQANVTLTIENGMKVDASATLNTLKSTNSNGGISSLQGGQMGSTTTINPATGSWSSLLPSSTSLNFNSVNSTIEQFLENAGNDYYVDFAVQLNPFGNTSGGWNELFPDSRIRVSLHVAMPLDISLQDVTVADTFDVTFKQTDNESKIRSAIFTLQATNAFPIGADLQIELLDGNGSSLGMVSGSQPITSSLEGQVVNGVQCASSVVDFILSEDLAGNLSQVKKIRVLAVFRTPDPLTGSVQVVSIPVNAFLGIKIWSKLTIDVVI